MRKRYIDCAKGIGIGLVVLGHICRRNWEESIPVILIYTVNVQSFFIISGILIEETKEYRKSWGDILIRNSRRLLIPYFAFETLYNLVFACINGFSTFKWQEIDTLIFYGRGIATWFLPTLFLAKMLLLFFLKNLHNRTVAYTAAGILFGIGLFHEFLFPSLTIWQARFVFRAFLAVGFLAAGILLSRKIDLFLSHKAAGLALAAVYLTAAVLNGQVSTYLIELNNPLLYAAAAVSGTVLLLAICSAFSNRLLEYWGRNSIVILGTHQAILYVFQFLLGKDYSVYLAILLWIIIMLMEFPIIEGINRWAPFLIGKTNRSQYCFPPWNKR